MKKISLMLILASMSIMLTGCSSSNSWPTVAGPKAIIENITPFEACIPVAVDSQCDWKFTVTNKANGKQRSFKKSENDKLDYITLEIDGSKTFVALTPDGLKAVDNGVYSLDNCNIYIDYVKDKTGNYLIKDNKAM